MKTFLLETIVRHKRISSTVREWQKTAPKLYLRDILIFCTWEDAVKDVVMTLIEKKEDFRLHILNLVFSSSSSLRLLQYRQVEWT